MESETKICQNCKKDFTMESEDFNFYEKIKVPPPTFCPECRMRRRMAWRNERTIYRRNCDKCKKVTISVYNPTTPFIIYCHDCFFSDFWDQTVSGREYDFNKPFFEQYKELQLRQPRLAANHSNNVINSEYSNHTAEVKNCFLSFASVNSEDCSYVNYVNYSKNIFDGLRVFKSERCYECIDCTNCQGIKYSQLCQDSFDSSFLYNCRGCSNCILCTNLVNKSYCILNHQYKREDYLKKIKEIFLDSQDGIKKIVPQFEKLKLDTIRRSVEGINNVRSTGSMLHNTKNCHVCFDLSDAEDCAYITYGTSVKDTMDVYGAYPKTELCYESVAVGAPSYRCFFSYLPWTGSDIWYSDNVQMGSSNLFGCIQLKKKSYCILNKQYTKEEYEKLVPKIIKHMKDMPFIDKKGNEYRFGEFFPPEISPFAYNETLAQQYFSISAEDATSLGYRWYNKPDLDYKATMNVNDLPQNIHEIKDSIINEAFECSHEGECADQCTKAFRITLNELIFYRQNNIPLPILCPNCRHYERVKKRNPFKLWHRQCMCDKENHEHSGKCLNEFETSYSPKRSEIVYCERCYKKEVY